jgi:hypothetical protein
MTFSHPTGTPATEAVDKARGKDIDEALARANAKATAKVNVRLKLLLTV